MALNMAIKLEDQLLLPMLILVMDILPITFLVSNALSDYRQAIYIPSRLQEAPSGSLLPLFLLLLLAIMLTLFLLMGLLLALPLLLIPLLLAMLLLL